MRQIFYGLLFLIFTVPLVKGQDVKKNTFFFEGGGKGLYYSLNYDRLFAIKSETRFSWRVGAGFFSERNNKGTFTLPVGLNLLLGKDLHFFEVGYGITYYHIFINKINIGDGTGKLRNFLSTYISNNLSFGYRRQPSDAGIFFAATLTLNFAPINIYTNEVRYIYLDNFIVNSKIVPFVGVSIGYSF